jgi:hypothetical protein
LRQPEGGVLSLSKQLPRNEQAAWHSPLWAWGGGINEPICPKWEKNLVKISAIGYHLTFLQGLPDNFIDISTF